MALFLFPFVSYGFFGCRNLHFYNTKNTSTISKWFLKFIRRHNKTILNGNTISKEDKIKYILPEVNFHGLRHTSATLLINQHVDVSTVSKRLGHARTSTTMDIYAHALQKSDIEAANKLENLFNKSTQNKNQG